MHKYPGSELMIPWKNCSSTREAQRDTCQGIVAKWQEQSLLPNFQEQNQKQKTKYCMKEIEGLNFGASTRQEMTEVKDFEWKSSTLSSYLEPKLGNCDMEWCPNLGLGICGVFVDDLTTELESETLN